jgi:hypothetical protein
MIIRGFVYESLEASTISPKGISGVAVSNGHQIVHTDEHGYYEIAAPSRGFIFVIKPSAYRLPIDEFNQPQYFLPYFSEGLPRHIQLRYPWRDIEGDLSEEYNFYLLPEERSDKFTAIVMGDIQPKTEQDVDYFRILVAKALAHREADFLLPLGDLAWDNLSLYPLIKSSLQTAGLPFFPICGNHDINLEAPNKEYATETFEHYFGPTYYSFNHGKVHFVVLEDIGYTGWKEEEGRKGETQGWIDQEQLDWLREDLKYVPNDYLVFIATHIPVYTDTASENAYRNVQNRQALFDILKGRQHLFAVSAHTHCVEHVDLRLGGWDGPVPFRSLIAGAACGAWWKGPLDLNDLPVCLAMDGAPNGFFTFHFDGPGFTTEFCPVGQLECYQIGVRYPTGEMEESRHTNSKIMVNVYNAPPESKVVFRLNGSSFYEMERVVGTDPYVEYFLEKHKDAYPEWMKARVTAHFWASEWPFELEAGTHTMEVLAEDAHGQTLKTRHSFRVKKSSSQLKEDKRLDSFSAVGQ